MARIQYLTIGQVLDRLKPAFPDLSISKIRYLEEQRLVRPKRSRGGYRMFSEADVVRLEMGLRLQKEQYLPLSVVRKRLDAMGRGKGLPEPEAEAPDEEDREGQTAERASSATGLSVDVIKDLEKIGLFGRSGTGASSFSTLDVEIMHVARDFMALGMEPRHLRIYQGMTDREITLFKQMLLPLTKQKSEKTHEMITDTLEELIRLSGRFKSLLMRRAAGKEF